MRSAFEVWRRNLLLWAVPLAVCVLGLIGVGVYYSSFQSRVEVLEKRQQRLSDNLDTYREESREIAEFLERVESQRQQVRALYGEHFQTEDARFLPAIVEARRLARTAGLDPSSFSYPTQNEGSGLIRRYINFSVNGTYRQLRTFINLLEHSDQFLTLESIALSGDVAQGNQEPRLSIGLRLTTFFANQPVADEPDGSASGGGGPDSDSPNGEEPAGESSSEGSDDESSGDEASEGDEDTSDTDTTASVADGGQA